MQNLQHITLIKLFPSASFLQNHVCNDIKQLHKKEFSSTVLVTYILARSAAAHTFRSEPVLSILVSD